VTDKRHGVDHTARARGETREQVLDRNLNELLQELRVVLTGVQILFAFLLALAFTADLDERGPFPTIVYTITLMSIACATVVLIAPVSFHRTVFRRQRKEELVAFADRALLVGLGLLLVGICSAVLLVLDVVLGRWPAVIGCGLVASVALVAWYAVPLAQRRRAAD
jgi:O-antigen/teichoic acid export membrane protein